MKYVGASLLDKWSQGDGDKPTLLTLGNWFMMFQQSPDLHP